MVEKKKVGRPEIPEEEKKRQFSVTCPPNLYYDLRFRRAVKQFVNNYK